MPKNNITPTFNTASSHHTKNPHIVSTAITAYTKDPANSTLLHDNVFTAISHYNEQLMGHTDENLFDYATEITPIAITALLPFLKEGVTSLVFPEQ